MSERPFMQLYVSDYLGDTRHLSCEQHGAYLLLLMTMWNAGGVLPDDDVKLARICCLSLKKWRGIRDDIVAFFEVGGGLVTHARLTKELQKSESKSQSRASAGAMGGRAKSLKNKKPVVANATDLLCHSPDTIKIEDAGASSHKTRGSDLADFKTELSDLDSERIEAIVKHRRSKRGQLTGLAARLFRQDAEACGLSIADAVDACISRNWITVKPEYLSGKQVRSTSPPKPLTQGESLRNMAREAGVIDAAGNPIRRMDTSDRDREDPGTGNLVRLAVAGNHGW